jgi:hypothetical protein
MHIYFKQEGGFAFIPNLAKPKEIDTENLEKEKAEKLVSYVKNANFFQLGDSLGQMPAGAADYFTYTITIKEPGRQKTIKIVEPIADVALQNLIDFLLSLN